MAFHGMRHVYVCAVISLLLCRKDGLELHQSTRHGDTGVARRRKLKWETDQTFQQVESNPAGRRLSGQTYRLGWGPQSRPNLIRLQVLHELWEKLLAVSSSCWDPGSAILPACVSETRSDSRPESPALKRHHVALSPKQHTVALAMGTGTQLRLQP